MSSPVLGLLFGAWGGTRTPTGTGAPALPQKDGVPAWQGGFISHLHLVRTTGGGGGGGAWAGLGGAPALFRWMTQPLQFWLLGWGWGWGSGRGSGVRGTAQGSCVRREVP